MTRLKKVLSIITIGFIVLVLCLMFVLSRTSACPESPPPEGNLQSMRAILYHCYGGPDVLQLRKVDKPVIADDEILVKVKAAAVNPLDWHYMRGSPYLGRLMMGLGAPNDPRLGVDFSGTVEAVGKTVTQFKIGDDVFGGANGAYAEYVKIVEDKAVALKPANVSFEQVAAMPIAAITALQALRDKGRLKAGQKILINGASGGVGTFAVQIAKSFGAQVSGVCSTRNVELVRSLGADHVFDYKKVDFTESGERFDLILDNVGNRSTLDLQKVLKPNGILVAIGGSKGDWIGPFKNIIAAQLISPFVDNKMLFFIAEMKRQDLVTLGELIQSGEIRSVIDRRYSLDEVPDAIRYSESGRARGKIIIKF